MAKTEISGLTAQQSMAQAREDIMIQKIIDIALEFYQDPKNRQAYEEWAKTQHTEAEND